MEVKDRIDLYSRALIRWGREAQVDMVIEELSELITKIIHFKRNRIKHYDLCEEIADVEIMLEQLKWIFTLESKVEREKQNKLIRLKERINSNIKKKN